MMRLWLLVIFLGTLGVLNMHTEGVPVSNTTERAPRGKRAATRCGDPCDLPGAQYEWGSCPAVCPTCELELDSLASYGVCEKKSGTCGGKCDLPGSSLVYGSSCPAECSACVGTYVGICTHVTTTTTTTLKPTTKYVASCDWSSEYEGLCSADADCPVDCPKCFFQTTTSWLGKCKKP